MASLNTEYTQDKHTLMELGYEYQLNHLINDNCLSVISDGIHG